MEGAQVKLPLQRLIHAVAQGDEEVKPIIEKALVEMAIRHQIPAKLALPLLEEILEKIKEERLKWSSKAPYPPINTNNMSIQVKLPAAGSIGVVEYNSVVDL